MITVIYEKRVIEIHENKQLKNKEDFESIAKYRIELLAENQDFWEKPKIIDNELLRKLSKLGITLRAF